MLFYKCWREIRTRVLTGVFLIAAYCALIAVLQPGIGAMHISYFAYISWMYFDSTGKIVFVLPLIFLGMGGLLRERAHHQQIFTLALPISRARLAWTQIAVASAGLALFATLPAVLIGPFSAIVGKSFPLTLAARYALLRFICGSFILAMSYLLSVLLKGEYTAPVFSYFGMFLPGRIANWSPIRPWGLNLMSTMAGRWYVWQEPQSRLIHSSHITDPFPWIGLSIFLLTALGLFAFAVRITKRQEV